MPFNKNYEKTMKTIFFDASALSRKRTGIEKLTFHILKILVQVDKENEYHIVFRKHIDKTIVEMAGKNCKIYLSPFASQILTEQVYIPWIIALNKIDISVFCCFPPGLMVRGKTALYCHDAANWKYINCLSFKNRIYFKPLTEIALRRAEIVFTNSASSASDIARYFPFIGKKLHLLSPSLCNEETFSIYRDDSCLSDLAEYGITKRYLLCVGSLEPRKNVEFIIRNLDEVLERFDLLLVLTGRAAWGKNDIDNAIGQSRCRERIVKTGFVTNETLNVLYRFAEMFLFPSLYEGFGFPLLEAFACKCPVITSNVSSMPEVAGNAALLIDPKNGNDLRNAVIALLTDSLLKDELIKKGSERLKQYSWEKSASQFLKLIGNVRTAISYFPHK